MRMRDDWYRDAGCIQVPEETAATLVSWLCVVMGDADSEGQAAVLVLSEDALRELREIYHEIRDANVPQEMTHDPPR